MFIRFCLAVLIGVLLHGSAIAQYLQRAPDTLFFANKPLAYETITLKQYARRVKQGDIWEPKPYKNAFNDTLNNAPIPVVLYNGYYDGEQWNASQQSALAVTDSPYVHLLYVGGLVQGRANRILKFKELNTAPYVVFAADGSKPANITGWARIDLDADTHPDYLVTYSINSDYSDAYVSSSNSVKRMYAVSLAKKAVLLDTTLQLDGYVYGGHCGYAAAKNSEHPHSHTGYIDIAPNADTFRLYDSRRETDYYNLQDNLMDAQLKLKESIKNDGRDSMRLAYAFRDFYDELGLKPFFQWCDIYPRISVSFPPWVKSYLVYRPTPVGLVNQKQ